MGAILMLLLCVLQALVDVAAQGGCLASALAVMELVQSLVQVRGVDEQRVHEGSGGVSWMVHKGLQQ